LPYIPALHILQVPSLNDIYLHAKCSEVIIKVATEIVLLIILLRFHRNEHSLREWTLVYLSTIRWLSNPTVTVAEWERVVSR
jgi:hypothetical protein